MSFEIGTRKWFSGSPHWGARGVMDTILRLLEQEEITRSKARELIEAAWWGKPIPSAPWEKLNWCDLPEACEYLETCPICGRDITGPEFIRLPAKPKEG